MTLKVANGWCGIKTQLFIWEVWKQLKSAIKREYKHIPTNTSSEPLKSLKGQVSGDEPCELRWYLPWAGKPQTRELQLSGLTNYWQTGRRCES